MARLMSEPVALHEQGTEVTVRATKDVEAGGQLWHCYGPQVGQHVTPLRRQMLQKQYNFDCR